MSLPQYDAYMQSGLDWLNRVPAHWTQLKLKHFTHFTGGGTPSREVQDYWNGEIPWISPKDMKTEGIESAEERITGAGLAGSSSSLVGNGRVLMVVRSGILKHTIPVAINSVAVALNQDMKAMKFDPSICISKFFMRWVQGLNDNLLLTWAKQGATVESIDHNYLINTVVALPPIAEQVSISSFLDRETAKIDTLIDAQEKLIVLLAEKRQTAISHAVTLGLDPDTPMKDSGFASLTAVPAHWSVHRLKQVVRPGVSVSYGIVQPGPPLADGVPFIQTTNMSDGSFELECLQRTTQEIAAAYPRSRLVGGEVVLGIRASIGAAFVVPRHLAGANLSRGVARIECSDAIRPAYLVHALQSSATAHYWGLSKQGSTFNEVSIETVRGLPLAVPPLTEQDAICRYLEIELAKLDALKLQAKSTVELLWERRISLIAASVTGQIDVRDATPHTAKHEEITV